MHRLEPVRATALALALLLVTAAPGLAPAGGSFGGHDRELLDAYDADGDGRLSREERTDLVFGETDTNGDGLISRDEWQAAQDARHERRAERREQLLAEYDADGDGELSRDERLQAREDGALHGKRHGCREGRGPRHGDGTVD